eukprot:TRINITY_DN28155_c0_g1_i1.p1 TRINITY_DN28155_c0_g1~~TRINITY_DN28155_c0_g1_i1.p1  ORF type:complete len:479 (-),score=57.66 TRINITY_DN28155_c0_g1_i1:143-1366(-)
MAEGLQIEVRLTVSGSALAPRVLIVHPCSQNWPLQPGFSQCSSCGATARYMPLLTTNRSCRIEWVYMPEGVYEVILQNEASQPAAASVFYSISVKLGKPEFAFSGRCSPSDGSKVVCAFSLPFTGSFRNPFELDPADYVHNTPPTSTELSCGERDVHGNLMGERYDLAKDGSFEGFRLLIGCFYAGVASSLRLLALPELHKKGWSVVVLQDVGDFTAALTCDRFHVAWIISGSDFPGPRDAFAKAVRQFHETGRGIMIWADNAPFVVHANTVLRDLFDFQLQGLTPGGKVMQLGDGTLPGHIAQHPITQGIENLYEGTTISYPDRVCDGWIVLGTSSDGKPAVVIKDASRGQAGAGKVVVDVGFTKLLKAFWKSAGTSRYVSNSCTWLAWRERFPDSLSGMELASKL